MDIINYVLWCAVEFGSRMGVYTSNNHSQQGRARFSYRVKVSRYSATCISTTCIEIPPVLKETTYVMQ